MPGDFYYGRPAQIWRRTCISTRALDALGDTARKRPWRDLQSLDLALLDLLNPLTWWGHLRGKRELQIAEERFHADRAAKIGARYERSDPPRVLQSRGSSAATGRSTPLGAQHTRHVFLVVCAGPWYAADATLWIAYGDDLDVPRTEERVVGTLRPSDPERRVEFTEILPDQWTEHDGALMCRWTDGNGTHVESLLVLTVRI